MNIRNIKSKISAKLDEWLLSITDEKLRKDAKKNILVSGGCITSMLLDEPVNDYDIYLMDIDVCKRLTEYYAKDHAEHIDILDGRKKEDLLKDKEDLLKDTDAIFDDPIANAYNVAVNNLREDQIKIFVKDGEGGHKVKYDDNEDLKAANPESDDSEKVELFYKPLYFSANAISLSDDIQIVIRFWGNAERIHKTFDFVHATNYFTFEEGLVTNTDALESILAKQLRYQGSLYPLTSIIRVRKFLKRGYTISAGELLKIMFQISLLDLTDINVLEEQLIGVDVAYFNMLIRELRDYFANNEKITSEVFNNIIDKIFNE